MKVLLKKNTYNKKTYFGDEKYSTWSIWRNGVQIRSFDSEKDARSFCEEVGFEIDGYSRDYRISRIVESELDLEDMKRVYPDYTVEEM